MLKDIILTGAEQKLTEMDEATIKEIQEILRYCKVYDGETDGKAGIRTINGLAEFKHIRWLENPDTIGRSTALSLLEGIHSTPKDIPKVTNPPAEDSSKSGKSMELPDGTTVWEFQRIVKDIPYLKWGEVTRGCDRVPESNQVVRNIIRATKGFAGIREKFGVPMTINSGYRPPNVNRAVGGATHSQHLYGLALDIYPSNGDFDRLIEVVKDSDAVGLGLGQSQGFLHVDWRGGDRVVFTYG